MEIIRRTRTARTDLHTLTAEDKNRLLLSMAESLRRHTMDILRANALDVEAARGKISDVMLDRLRLDEGRIAAMADGICAVAQLPDHTGRILSETKHPNGMIIYKKQVPLGLVAIIYESRPNVTSDAAALAIKSGNVCVLRSGREAIGSARAITAALKEGISAVGGNPDILNILEDTSHDSARQLMQAKGLVDLLIPRGGAGLIRACVENATVPCIETGTGICHVYVDETADIEMAVNIIVNAKTQRLGVCNACESLVIHEAIAEKAIPEICKALYAHEVEIRGDEISQKYDAKIVPATEEDYGKEYLDRIISMKVVPDIDAAIAHINKYNTGHSESIITKDYESSMRFLNEIDAAAVYVNASTRFTDGFEFGFGAEIGISTQKLHARGPMGLLALTSTKYIILGNGQIRR